MNDERPLIDNTLNKKSDAFDLVVEALTEAGFDTANSTYPDIVALVRSLSVEGLDAATVRMTSEIVKRYEEVNRLHSAYLEEVVPLYEELRKLTTSWTDISKNVTLLMHEHNDNSTSERARRRESLLGLLGVCEKLGGNPAVGDMPSVALAKPEYHTLSGMAKLLKSLENGKVTNAR